MTVVVRPARPADLDHLGSLEDSGLALFESVLGDLAGSPLAAPAPSGRERAAQEGILLVAAPADEAAPVGFVHVLMLDGYAHLEQLSVHPERMREGIGTALVEAACTALERRGLNAVTLLTYADLPWNAPWYARRGFAEVRADEKRLPHQTRLERAEEELGLDRHGRRVLMRRALRTHRTAEELATLLPELDATPKDEGALVLVVRRPGAGLREVLEVGELDPDQGLVGDDWQLRGDAKSPDGSADPDTQVTVMSHPMIAFLAQDPEREPLAGDQLYVDLDLSEQNLPARSRLVIGEPEAGHDRGAVIEVTEQPHTGCGLFIDRFGAAGMRFVNGREGRPRRLRGLNARVAVPGLVRPGDRVRVERPSR